MSNDTDFSATSIDRDTNSLEQVKKPKFFVNVKSISNDEFFKIFVKLKGKFPALFSLEDVKVFKIGIHKELREYKEELDLTAGQLSNFINHYTNTPHYIEAHYIDANRYDLDGNIVGKVTPEEYKIKMKSNKIFKKIIKIIEEKNLQKDK